MVNLQIGPERTNHSLENIWSNMTRRKNIQNTLKQKTHKSRGNV